MIQYEVKTTLLFLFSVFFGLMSNAGCQSYSNTSASLNHSNEPGLISSETQSIDANALSMDAEELKMLTLINQHRADNGLTPLKISPALSASAQWMSGDMAAYNYFDHT